MLVQPPEGEAREIRARSDQERWATYARTEKPGWYAVEQRAGPRKLAGGSIPGFFVRPPAIESDPTPLGTDRLRGLLGQQTRLRVAGASGDSSHSKTGLLLLLVLALALCEAVLVRR